MLFVSFFLSNKSIQLIYIYINKSIYVYIYIYIYIYIYKIIIIIICRTNQKLDSKREIKII